MSALAPAFAPTSTSTWMIDPTHSHVEFAVKHMMIATVKGRFAEVSGIVTVDETDITRSTIDVSIPAASVDTRMEQRDQHLRSADFFDAANYPEITFRSREIEPGPGGEFRVTGDLTMRGVTRAVVLDVEETGRAQDPWGQERAAYSLRGKVDRTDFGLNWNQAMEAGGVLVSHDVRIAIEVELVRN
ncbi:MAG: YceI family protein [Pseudonocardiaceae bacterium]